MRVLRAGARAGAWTFGGLAALLAVLLSPAVVAHDGGDLPISFWSAAGWYLAVLVGLVLPVSLVVAIVRGAGQVVLEEQQHARAPTAEPPG